MIAVTVVTPSYRHLEKEAVRRVKKFTGLPVKVIRCKDKDGFMKKLELDKECGKQRIMFFDVDWWPLRRVDFAKWDDRPWYSLNDSAVHNPHAFPHTDCGSHNLDKRRYFNSGFFVCDLSNKNHHSVFVEARKLRKAALAKKLAMPVDTTDQFWLNMAVQKLNVMQEMLPLAFNYYHRAAQWSQIPFIPREIIGAHAAGEILSNKLPVLAALDRLFSYPEGVSPIHEGVILAQYERVFHSV